MAFVQPFTSINPRRPRRQPTSVVRTDQPSKIYAAALREVLAWENSSDEGEADGAPPRDASVSSYVDAWVGAWLREHAREAQALQAEAPDEPRFARIQALVRSPDGAPDAYRAMVEENELRANLNYEIVVPGVPSTVTVVVTLLWRDASRVGSEGASDVCIGQACVQVRSMRA